jgi:hypothetical protein
MMAALSTMERDTEAVPDTAVIVMKKDTAVTAEAEVTAIVAVPF